MSYLTRGCEPDCRYEMNPRGWTPAFHIQWSRSLLYFARFMQTDFPYQAGMHDMLGCNTVEEAGLAATASHLEQEVARLRSEVGILEQSAVIRDNEMGRLRAEMGRYLSHNTFLARRDLMLRSEVSVLRQMLP